MLRRNVMWRAPPRLTPQMSRLSSRAPLFTPAEPLLEADINPHVIKAKYAVRGPIPARAEELRRQLKLNPGLLPFTEIISANIGNPQQLDQKPLTWYRKVLLLLQYPPMLDHPETLKVFFPEALERARELLTEIGSVGAYSHSQGVPLLRELVADFITKRDGGHKALADDIFLTAGALAAVSYVLTAICLGPQLGVLIPIPQYPLYTASLALLNSTPLPYYLDEAHEWSTNPEEIKRVITEARADGIAPRALVVINPGNPTGAILTYDAIVDIINVAAEHGVVVIADEVYQENVFRGEFVLVRKVLKDLMEAHPDTYLNVQLVLLHSTSKGFTGECGQRGGYMELINFSQPVMAALTKLALVNLCPVVTGQALVELMVNPPTGDTQSGILYREQRAAIIDRLALRLKALHQLFSSMEGVLCHQPQGAMYLFPLLTIPEKAQKAAAEKGLQPDELYCTELLEATGICTVPGSGFGQVPGTWHVRTTFLAPGTEWLLAWEKFHQQFMDKYR